MTMEAKKPDMPAAPTIFVIDDDEDVRTSLSRLLRAAGWQVETFASADQFLERPAYPGTGCVLLDVDMPGMTGPCLHQTMLARGSEDGFVGRIEVKLIGHAGSLTAVGQIVYRIH